MRPAARWLLCGVFVLACGRVGLDLGPDSDASGSAGSSGSGGSTGRAGSTGGAGSGTGSGGSAGTSPAPVRVPAVHRPTAASCPIMMPPPHQSCGLIGTGPCKSDGDCTDGKDGLCVLSLTVAACSCTYDQCFSDDDCPAGTLCSCSGFYSGNTCVSGSCHVDADCGVGGYCSPVVAGCSGQVIGYACHKADDKCSDNKDCPFSSSCAPEFGTGSWVCGLANGCPL